MNGCEMDSLLLGRPVEVPEQLMQHYSVLGQVRAEKRPRRHHGEGLICCWGRCGFHRGGRPKSGYRTLTPPWLFSPVGGELNRFQVV